MSLDSRTFVDEGNHQENNSSVVYHRRDTHFGATVRSTSSVVVNISQLQTDLHSQHQHDKSSLIELNQRFHLFVDHVQQLQLQNSKYLAAITDLKRQYSGISSIDVHWDERYFAIQSNFSTVRDAKVDYDWEFELFQKQITIYRELIGIEQQWKDKGSLALEEEFKKSSSILISLRTAYAELQREVQSLYAEYDNLLKQYLVVSDNWCTVKKELSKWKQRVETLKRHIGFYKNIRSYSVREFDSSSSVQTDDTTQFSTFDLETVVKRIRSDFEAFYATIYREMATQYEAKMEEMEVNVKQTLHYQQIEMKEFVMIYPAQQVEYEKVQMTLTYEKEILINLETTYSKMEAEFKSIQFQYEERFGTQSTDLYNVQESIARMIYDVDEIRRSKANLEAEIIVYGLLLDCSEVGKRETIATRIPIGGSTMTGKVAVKKENRGLIGIEECAVNGAYISLINHSTNKDVDISRWVLTRNIDSSNKLHYTIPDRVRLAPGSELRIYTKLSSGGTSESAAIQNLVNKDLTSWGTGNSTKTVLFNQNDEEEASHLQSVESKKTKYDQ